MRAEFVPVRWWQMLGFIRLNFEIMRGHDLWVDRVLARPWALSSLVEYGYVLIGLASSDAFFITISGERVGVLWLIRRSSLLYLNSLGLASRFSASDVGLLAGRLLVQVVRFMEGYAARHNSELFVSKTRADNPIQRMPKLFRCRPLGLATATLRLSSAVRPASLPAEIEVVPVRRLRAAEIWKRWRLYGVEQIAGHLGVEAAKGVMKWFYWMTALPRGKYWALYQDGQEIGFAFAREREDGLELGLFPSSSFYSGLQTVALVEILALHVRSPIQYVTVTRTHADALGETGYLGYERERDLEWLFVFRPVDLDRWQDADEAS